MATEHGQMVDGVMQRQPEPGSGVPGLSHDGRAYWKARALAAESRLRLLHEEYAALVASRPPPDPGRP